jgi:hypothetical protein
MAKGFRVDMPFLILKTNDLRQSIYRGTYHDVKGGLGSMMLDCTIALLTGVPTTTEPDRMAALLSASVFIVPRIVKRAMRRGQG